MLKIQFRLNNFKTCHRFFKWIDTNTKEGYMLSDFPQSYLVTLSYYRGRYHLYNNELKEARTELRQAYLCCHKNYGMNKKKILKYLIPVEMNLFNFPSKQLLQKYQLTHYLGIA